MLTVTRAELGKLMSGEADGVTRQYPAGCPHKVGDKMVLSSEAIEDSKGTVAGRDTPFAGATVVSVRPCRVDERRKDNRLAKMDGFSNGADWYTHLSRILYKREFEDGEQMFRLQLRIEKLDKGEAAEMLPTAGN